MNDTCARLALAPSALPASRIGTANLITGKLTGQYKISAIADKRRHTSVRLFVICSTQGRIKARTGPGAVPNVGPLQTYNQLTG